MIEQTIPARELRTGDRIVRDSEIFPQSLYSGVVRYTERIDDPFNPKRELLRIVLRDGQFTRTPHHPLVVLR